MISVSIPNSVTSIGESSFQGCSGMTSVSIPNSVTSIGWSAFRGCSGLTSVSIPNSVTSIGWSAFQGCSGLTSVSIPNSVTSISPGTFRDCENLSSVTIPSSVKKIDKFAFAGCSILTSITIGTGIKDIYANAFSDCPELTTVYCKAEQVPTTDATAFDGSFINYAILYVPAAAVASYSAAAPWSSFNSVAALSSLYQTPVFEEKGEYSFKYNLTSNPAGTSKINVVVEKSMGWKGLSDKRELGNYVFAGPAAAHANYPVWTVDASNATKLSYDMDAANNIAVRKIGLDDNDVSYQIVALADKAPDEVFSLNTFTNSSATHEIRKNHLYETVGYEGTPQAWDAVSGSQRWNDVKGYGAIPMPATHGVVYNGSIDLMDYVVTHYNYLNQNGQSTYDAVMTDALMTQLGLEYRFTIVNYWLNNGSVSESAYIEQDANSPSVFYPRSVNTNGNTITGQTATSEIVDREPLIRVDLVSTNDNNAIIRYGYIKLRIVESESNVNDFEVAIDLNKVLYMNSGDEATVTWSQIEDQILTSLGTSGITKQEFETNYKLDVYGGYEYMPFITPTNFSASNTDKPGPLYTKTWQAKRYYRKTGEASTSIATTEATNYAAALAEDRLNNWTLANNHFGEVWYTPHDDAGGYNWNSQTNVLNWNFYPGDYTIDRTVYNATTFGKEQAGTMNDAKYQKLINLTGATYENGGNSQRAVSTVVRFINKQTDRSIWVTLKVPSRNIYFAYADINNRDADQWYDYNTGYETNTSDAIEVYANVPTPTEANRATGVTVNGFTKDLTECWLDQDINNAVIFHGVVAKFDKFTGGKSSVSFRFRLPEQGVNADFSADANGQWTVLGASGATWTVKLNKSNSGNDEIVAVKKNGAAYGPTVICTLTKAGTIHWMGRTEGSTLYDNGALTTNQEDVNEPANDILNYMGLYDDEGTLQRTTYLSGQQNKTFAAYVEVQVTNDGYNPLVGKNYLNVRFLRPINVWPAEAEWDEASNTAQIYDIWKLINIRDWRTYAVVPDNQEQVLNDNITYEGEYVDGEKASVPYSFYNISNIYVERAAIKSDAYLEPSLRGSTAIADLLTIDEIPILTKKDGNVVSREYLKIMPAGTTAATAGSTAIGLSESTQSGDILVYTNNGGIVQTFHIYVPVKVVYSHGALKPWTQTVWATITVGQSNNDNPAEIEVTDISKLDDAIYVEPTESSAGEVIDLPVQLKNTMSAIGCSFRLTLPEGFTLQKDGEGDVIYELASRARKMSLNVNERNDGSYDFALVPSTASATISGNSGTFITFKAVIPENAAEGDYALLLTNNLIQSKVDDTIRDFPQPDITTVINVSNYVIGDVNGDGFVTPSDAIMILYYYFEVELNGFNEKAADINGDGFITPADAIAALYMYFNAGSSNSNARVKQAIDSIDPQ